MNSEARPVYSHGIMFHHFHDEVHPIGQGSLSQQKFSEMIDWLMERYNLLGAGEYLYKFNNQSLDDKDICLTFDDALLCQYDIAAPILRKRGIDAFFFIYSSPYFDSPDFLEVYRFFRSTVFSGIDDFYEEFFSEVQKLFNTLYERAMAKFNPLEYLLEHGFYTENDKLMRFLRDDILGEERYKDVMDSLMAKKNFIPKSVFHKLWMSENNIRSLHADGHCVGLHSFAHPTTFDRLDVMSQIQEYKKNMEHLSGIIGQNLISMSHPCGKYNKDTIDILHEMKIQIGFRADMKCAEKISKFEIPRKDHAEIMHAMSL